MRATNQPINTRENDFRANKSPDLLSTTREQEADASSNNERETCLVVSEG